MNMGIITLWYTHSPLTQALQLKLYHQLAFFTPGRLPARAFILKGNYRTTFVSRQCMPSPPLGLAEATTALSLSSQDITTYSCHPKVPEYTPALPTFYASVVDLGAAGIAVHLAELELCLCPGALRQGRIADDVAECLPEVLKRSFVSPRHDLTKRS